MAQFGIFGSTAAGACIVCIIAFMAKKAQIASMAVPLVGMSVLSWSAVEESWEKQRYANNATMLRQQFSNAQQFPEQRPER